MSVIPVCRIASAESLLKTSVFFLPVNTAISKALIVKEGARVMSLTDGTSKMSKSDPVEGSRINLTDSPDVITRKVRILLDDCVLRVFVVCTVWTGIPVAMCPCLK